MKAKEDSKLRQLHTNVNKDKPKSGNEEIARQQKENKGEELIKRLEVENTPFMIITSDERSWGVLGNYRITEFGKKKDILKELKEITWNRIIQVIMILNEIQENNNLKNKK